MTSNIKYTILNNKLYYRIITIDDDNVETTTDWLEYTEELPVPRISDGTVCKRYYLFKYEQAVGDSLSETDGIWKYSNASSYGKLSLNYYYDDSKLNYNYINDGPKSLQNHVLSKGIDKGGELIRYYILRDLTHNERIYNVIENNSFVDNFGILTIIKVGDEYKLIKFISQDTTCEQWEELKVPIEQSETPDWDNVITDSLLEGTTLADSYNILYSNSSESEQPIHIVPETTVTESINSIDVNADGLLFDFRQGYENQTILRNSPYNKDPITLCAEVPVYDVSYEYQNGNDVETRYTTTNTTYILYQVVRNNMGTQYYPLYCPELFEQYGIGFIKSDWLTYDSNGNLLVEWWPEKSGNLFWYKSSQSADVDEKSDGVNLTLYSQSNPLYGRVKSWKDADYLKTDSYRMLNAAQTIYGPDFYNYPPKKESTQSSGRTRTRSHVYVGEAFQSVFPSCKYPSQTDEGSYRFIEFDDDNNVRQCVIPEIYEITAENFTPDNWLYIDIAKPEINMFMNFFKFYNFHKKPDATTYVKNDYEPINNVAIWKNTSINNNKQLMLLGDYKSFYTIPNTYDNNYDSTVNGISTLIALKDTNDEPLLLYERWKTYVTFFVSTDSLPQMTERFLTEGQQQYQWYGLSYVKTKVSYESPANENPEEVLNELEKSNDWKTPSEYYNECPTAKFSGYTKTDTTINAKDAKNWFWVDDLANWCIWKRLDKYFIDLYVWNGKDGWDKFADIMNAWNISDWQTLKRTYYYNKDCFVKGPEYNQFEAMITSTGAKGILWYNTLLLRKNNKLSTYDANSFQNIRVSKFIPSDQRVALLPGYKKMQQNLYIPEGDDGMPIKTKYANLFTTLGCPCIIRGVSGQLNLLYRLQLEGDFTAKTLPHERHICREYVDYLNDICVGFFGDGNEKTIRKNWKRFTTVDDSEEIATGIVDETNETIYDRPSQINSVAEDINMHISFEAPRPNVVSKGTKHDDYALRWDR